MKDLDKYTKQINKHIELLNNIDDKELRLESFKTLISALIVAQKYQ